MKFSPKPITASDRVDQSRDISGFNKWAQSSRTISAIMLVLGWFTIPAEVFLRRDFGQRWFTVVNFYAGLMLMLLFAVMQYVLVAIWGGLHDFINRIATAINPFHTEEEPTYYGRVMDRSMLLLMVIYVILGSYHLFKIWWRNRSANALHSFDDGTSRCEPVAKYFIAVVNVVTIPFTGLYRLMLPSVLKKNVKTPKLINDCTAFTNTVFEPLLLLFLAYYFTGIASVWLFVTAVSLAIHANWKETARLSKILDFRDSIFEARAMKQLKVQTQTDMAQAPVSVTIMKQAAEAMKTEPNVAEKVANQYPDLMSIIEEVNGQFT